MMNNYVEKLYFKDMYFEIVYGLDVSGQYSLVYDLVVFFCVIIYGEFEFYYMYSEKSFIWNGIIQ